MLNSSAFKKLSNLAGKFFCCVVFFMVTVNANAAEKTVIRGIVSADDIMFGLVSYERGYEGVFWIEFSFDAWKNMENGQIIQHPLTIQSLEYDDPMGVARLDKLLTPGTIIEIFVDEITDTDNLAKTDATEVRLIEDKDLQTFYQTHLVKNEVFFHRQLGPFAYLEAEKKFVRALKLATGQGGIYYATWFELYPKTRQEMPALTAQALEIRQHFNGSRLSLGHEALKGIEAQFGELTAEQKNIKPEDLYVDLIKVTAEEILYRTTLTLNHKSYQLWIKDDRTTDGHTLSVVKDTLKLLPPTQS